MYKRQPDDQAVADALQRLEVRAFACLLGELLERCTGNAGIAATTTPLSDLQACCAQENNAARPLFAEIVQKLQDLLLQEEDVLLVASEGAIETLPA